MTAQRRFEGGTNFTNWIRNVPELDSYLGYSFTDVDAYWMCIKPDSSKYMFLEEKSHNGYPSNNQRQLFLKLNERCFDDKDYFGHHLLVFENNGVNDGYIKLDDNWILSIEKLILFLQFKGKPEWYSKKIIW